MSNETGQAGTPSKPKMLAIGIGGVALSLFMNAHLTERSGFDDLVQSMFVRSFSLAFVFIPISVVALSDIPAPQRGNAQRGVSLGERHGL